MKCIMLINDKTLSVQMLLVSLHSNRKSMVNGHSLMLFDIK